MMLHSALWERIEAQIGPVAVSVLACDLVVVVLRDTADLIAVMTDIRDQVLAESAYVRSERRFTCQDGAWSQLAP
ncbi:hypothetical protein [Actibacterium sp. 188UL27-1]|uniref:hypothetical protein n=1 Tax=Actibacterium sp. 188UL27-1 TaxID=2786961 RepID=UPI00195A7827|nr:hypothetical protein [Actibacterium sp. 188UL27-1]MBM7066270.1 hypothetical protein [Actibacterium sp. 188UL27-1]